MNYDDYLFARYTPPEELILRPIQEDIVNQVRVAMGCSQKLILQAATGVGKTIIATCMCQNAVKRSKRVLFIADRVVLVLQTSETFDKYGVDHGIIMADHPRHLPDRLVQIASAATLMNRDVGKFDLIIVDECHSITKGTLKAFDCNPDAYVLGLTATPYSSGLGKYYERHIQPYGVRDLINQGLLCDYEVYGPETIDLSGVKTVAGEYHQGDLADACDKPSLIADVIKTYKALGQGRKAICFCTNVAHGRHLEREFNKNKIPAVEVNGYDQKDGEDGTHERVNRFKKNKVKILISCEMMVKGFDVSDVACVIFATATRSIIKLTQALGRGLRVHEGIDICRVLDHGSNFSRLGFPEDYEIFELDDGKKAESKNKKNEQKKEKLPKKCPSCDFLKPAGVYICPRCGFKPTYAEDVETEEGTLKKVDREKKKNYTKQEKIDFYSQIKTHCIDRGHREGWCFYAFKEKFGLKKAPNFDTTPSKPITEEVMKWLVHYEIKKRAEWKNKK